MIGAMFILLGCELLGQLLRSALHLPIPGPVIGMLVLAAGMALLGQDQTLTRSAPASPLDRTAGMLLEHMGLLFIPAGVGIVAEIPLLRQEWLPILAALLVSTVLSLAVTGLIMHRLSEHRRRPVRAEQEVTP
jgi:holin-like protein